jgi:hypothetical protein
MIAIHIGLTQYRERHTIVDLAEALDIVVGSWLLAAKLVAREAKDDEIVAVGCFDFLVEGLETFVLGCEAALGSSVDDEDYLSFVGIEGDGYTFLCSAGGGVSMTAWRGIWGIVVEGLSGMVVECEEIEDKVAYYQEA